MSPKRISSSTIDPDRLSDQIELLQMAFRKLSKSATYKDLGRQLATVIRSTFTHRVVDLAYLPAGSETWERIGEGSAAGKKRLDEYLSGEQTLTTDIQIHSDTIMFVHRLADAALLGLVVSGPSEEHKIPDLEILALRLFITLFDNAYQDMLYRRNEKEMLFSLNHRILQLNSLIDTGIEVSTLNQKASPHRLALVRAVSLTNASRGVVRVKRRNKIMEEYTFPEATSVPGSAPAENVIRSSFVFSGDRYAFELFEKESRRGTLTFEETDQLLLDALARQVHASLENRFLHRQALEHQRIEQEMIVAAAIQNKIIPVALPAIAGYDVAGRNIPSKSVGGDYYDCIPLPNGQYALVVADVTGKGVPAAMLVSSLHAYLSAYLELAKSLPELLAKLNKALYATTTDDKFVTAFVAMLSPETGEIEYSSAGHNPAYLLKKNGTVEEIHIGGAPLGAFDMDFPYKSGRILIGKGERLLLYTDGVTEAMNEKNELYERKLSLPAFLARHKPARAETFITDLVDDVKKFTGHAPQSDDITALYLRRND